MTTVLVAGAIANKRGNAGAAWTRLSWLLGFRSLGYEIHFIEQLAPGAGPEAGEWFRRIAGRFGLESCSTLLDSQGGTVAGLRAGELADLAAGSALLVNISGHLYMPEVTKRVAGTVFVDLDPGYTQIWHAQGLAVLEPHDLWYTVGTQIGSAGCDIPTGGLPWRPTLQPVLLEEWPQCPPGVPDRFTTIGAWRGVFGPLEHQGRQLGLKAHEFRRFRSLPDLSPAEFELALDIHPADRRDRMALEEGGWKVVDPAEVAGDPDAFRRYIQRSSAELSVAQGVYVHTSSGWFSDRTGRYLSSARPAVVQETGVAGVPVGEGLLTFRTLEQAAGAVAAVVDEYSLHCRAARRLAEDHLDARVVLGSICREAGIAP